MIQIRGSICCVAGCALPRYLRGLLNTLRLREKRWVHVLARQATVRGKRQRRSIKAEWQPIGVVWFAARTVHPPWGVDVQQGKRRTLKAERQPCRFCLAQRTGDAPPCIVRAVHLKNSLSDATHVFFGVTCLSFFARWPRAAGPGRWPGPGCASRHCSCCCGPRRLSCEYARSLRVGSRRQAAPHEKMAGAQGLHGR
jgi:hypothetical protein